MDSHSRLEYVINHVFLPPKLPQCNDNSLPASKGLIGVLLRSLNSFKEFISTERRSQWDCCAAMLQAMMDLRQSDGRLSPQRLEERLLKMTPGDVLSLQITSQNAGVIVRRLSNAYVFELFELSAHNTDVMATKGRLIRCFPGPAITIKASRLADGDFCQTLAECLAELDRETPPDAWEISIKANTHFPEVRDSVHPKYVTEMLVGDVQRIYKRTRDDVAWKNELFPWRRSPLWLLLRVALQTTLADFGSPLTKRDNNYKSFMVYFMAQILSDAQQAQLTNDLLFVMAAKITRRLLKLQPTHRDPWLQYVEAQVETTTTWLKSSWELLEKDLATTMEVDWNYSYPYLRKNTVLKLATLRPYLESVKHRPIILSSNRPKTPLKNRPPLLISPNGLPHLPEPADEEGERLALAHVERWVRTDLEDWVTEHLSDDNACRFVASLFREYHVRARKIYADSPEDVSLMILTLLSLWVAADKCTIERHSLIRDYNPGILSSVFEPLLLPKKTLHDQLIGVLDYLDTRKDEADKSCPSIFSSINDRRSFSVRFFEQSPSHQALYQEILETATKERSEKMSELAEMQKAYKSQIKSLQTMFCETRERWDRQKKVIRHSPGCRKCKAAKIASQLAIKVHEWPLPQKSLTAKSVIFHLSIPEDIANWLDTTYSLIVDILSPGLHVAGMSHKLYTLENYEPLSEFSHSRGKRLKLASTSKLVVNTHFATKTMESNPSEEDICVNNGMHYRVCDMNRINFLGDMLTHCDISNACSLQLLNGQY
ncbi:hypothetical protein AJ80_01858 [Polytolypa hystricis UAMH7299]|uniref:DUF6606 domain-containing protein n=1 Tax=Polytolypa hystricis (strain UAMH7299) TaxID=1447883 RepID=A0A2B7YRA7_POLH7|nr:hypothetical protein AJ80_01858 [Polytolypa hystricis UAMH7299]